MTPRLTAAQRIVKQHGGVHNTGKRFDRASGLLKEAAERLADALRAANYQVRGIVLVKGDHEVIYA